jgi:hypothetical protein
MVNKPPVGVRRRRIPPMTAAPDRQQRTITCAHPDCTRPATHRLVRHLPEGYLPNPDQRHYCDAHRFPDLAAAAEAARAPVVRAEFIDLVDRPAV